MSLRARTASYIRHPTSHIRHHSAFTLVELLVAAVIVGFIGTATTMAVSQMLRTRDRAVSRLQAFTRAAAAADRIALDAQSAVRDGDLLMARVVVQNSGGSGGGGGGAGGAPELDGLLLFTRSMRRVRPSIGAGIDQPEGGEYEVQYRVEPTPIDILAQSGVPDIGSGTLWRRADPNPDEIPDGGGIAAPVTDGIVSLSLEAYDGSAWFPDWDSDLSGYPHAIRISITATDERGRTTAAARRTIALDRTPLPIPAEPEEDATDPSQPTSPQTNTPTTPTNPTPPGGNTGGGNGRGRGNPTPTNPNPPRGGGGGGGRGPGGGGGGGGGNTPAPTGPRPAPAPR